MSLILSRFHWSTLIIAVMMMAYLSPPAFAQGGISISPLITELELEAGKNYSRQVKVGNRDTVPLEVSAAAFDVEITPSTHAINFLPEASRANLQRSLAAWVKPVGQTSFLINPGDERVFEFEIRVPADAAQGDFFAAVNFSYLPPEAKRGNIKVQQSVGSLMLVSLAADGEQAVNAEDYVITEPQVSLLGDLVQVQAQVKNNTLKYVHLKPQLTVVDAAGKVVFQKDGNTKRVFPGEEASVDDDFPKSVVALAEGLTLKYSLVDARTQLKYFETSINLDNLSASWLGVLRIGFGVGIVIFLFIGLVVLMLRRPRKE